MSLRGEMENTVSLSSVGKIEYVEYRFMPKMVFPCAEISKYKNVEHQKYLTAI